MESFSGEISLISDPGSLRSRRGNRKGTATKAEHHLLLLRDMELIDINVEELETKLHYLQDAIEEYEVIQQHLDFVEGPDETAKHQDMVEAQRKSMLSIKKAVQRKIEACNLAVEIEVALADMRKVMKSTSFTSTNAQTRVKRVESTCTELSHKYVPL